jgi:hypothetical protein
MSSKAPNVYIGIRPIDLESTYQVVHQSDGMYSILVWHSTGSQESFSDLSEKEKDATVAKLERAGYKEEKKE